MNYFGLCVLNIVSYPKVASFQFALKTFLIQQVYRTVRNVCLYGVIVTKKNTAI